MTQFNSFSDVEKFAKIFGVASLQFALDNKTLTRDDAIVISDTFKWCVMTSFEVESFNDGNNEYSTTVSVKSYKNALGEYTFNLSDVMVTRYGFGQYHKPLGEAMENRDISVNNVQNALREFRERNEVRTILKL